MRPKRTVKLAEKSAGLKTDGKKVRTKRMMEEK